MQNYLTELFKEENTVIIPKLGALTLIDRNTNELMFMSYLKHNDGTLVRYIAKKENTTELEAKAKLEQYVATILDTIASGKTFEITKIGRFFKSADGEIQFITPQQYPSKEPNKKEEKKTENQPVKPEIKETVPEQIKKEAKTEKNTEKKEEKREEKTKKNVAKVEARTIEIKQSEEKTKESNKKRQATTIDNPPTIKRKRSIWRVVIMPILILLIIGGGIYFWLYYDSIKDKKATINPASAEMTKATNELEISEHEQTFTDDTQEEKAPETDRLSEIENHVFDETPTNPTSGKWLLDKNLPIQVIVGSFEDEDNAKKMINKLAQKGTYAENIGLYGGLYLVSIASFESMAEYRAIRSDLNEVGQHWVKKR